MPEQPRIVVVGGGFGGLNVVKVLRNQPVQVTLIDRQNYHLFRPLLYQVAMAGLSPGDIALPLRVIFRRNPNIRTILGEVIDIDARARRVLLADGQSEPYDYLVVAGGARYDYFGHNDWAPHAPSLEGVEGALEIRRRLLTAYEKAELEPDPARRQAWLTFTVVGGGPTGVELAGALGELAKHTLEQNFRTINPADTRVLLVETEDRVLGTFPAELSAKAERSLAALGVTVRTNSRVVEISQDSVTLKWGDQTEQIPCCTTLWAAGVRAVRLGEALQRATGAEIDRRGRVKIQPDLTLPNHPEIYAIGDMTYLEQEGKPLPGVAPVAIQQGKHAARQILGEAKGEPHQPFHYVDRGNMATIGRAAAVADLYFVKLDGFLAWLAWLFVHVINLIGFRNRLSVLSQWILNYFTYTRSVRLIVGQGLPPPPPPPPTLTDGRVQQAGGVPIERERAARLEEGPTYAA